MIYYFTLLLIPCIASFSWQKAGSKRDFWLALYFIVLLAFVGLRDQVGPDWQAYQWNYQAAEMLPWADIIHQREPGFFFLEKVSSSLGWDVHGINFLCATLFLSGVFAYARRTANPWLAIAMVVPYLVFVVGMSGIRQSAAIGLMLLMLVSWQKTGLLFKVGLILAATSIHSSAILLSIFLVVRNDRYLPLRLLVAGGIALISASAITDSAAFARYTQAYIENNVESEGALLQVALSTFPALVFLLFRSKIRAWCQPSQQLELGVLMAVAAMLLVPLSTTGVSRAALYLSFVQMWVYPAFAYANAHRMFATLAVAMISIVVFFVYFLFGTHAFGYLPYQSIML